MVSVTTPIVETKRSEKRGNLLGFSERSPWKFEVSGTGHNGCKGGNISVIVPLHAICVPFHLHEVEWSLKHSRLFACTLLCGLVRLIRNLGGIFLPETGLLEPQLNLVLLT